MAFRSELTLCAALFLLCCPSRVFADKLQITSNPPGATVELDGVAVGGEVGPPDDLLEVYLPDPGNARGALVWQRTLADGLNPPQLTLIKQLKDEVERTYPLQTATKASKP